MDNEKELQDFNLEDVMQELQHAAEDPQDAAPLPRSEIDDIIDGEELTGAEAELAAFFSELAQDPENVSGQPTAAEGDTIVHEPVILTIPEESEDSSEDIPANSAPTLRVDTSEPSAPEQEDMTATTRVAAAAPEAAAEPAAAPEEKVVPRNVLLRELKKKIVAGPEKKYYDLNSIGVGKLQQAALICAVMLLLCGVAITLFTTGNVPATRMKLLIFSQVLALLCSGLVGCYLMLDGISDLFRLRFSLNSTLFVSFVACCADAWFSLADQRVPCCGAFVLEMLMALLARYYRRKTEMSQMDTMRKASSLTGLTKHPKFYGKYTAIVRGAGDVEDFMDTYAKTSGPELVQRTYAFIALIACIGIAVLAGLLHGIEMGVQIFAAAMMAAVPAGYFITLVRPAAVLETRLHMVGTVICGWQGVKKLCGKAVFPLRDKDLFPRGSTKLNGIKYYSDRVPAEVVSYTASLIFAAGGGLVPLFENLLTSRSGVRYPVTEFRDYGNGGVGGVVNNEAVLLGSQEFLQDMGVEIPAGTDVSQAIYIAIDGELAAVIAITYSKMRSAAAGLVSLCSSWLLKPLLLAGDFMLTDSFIRSKFSIRGRKIIMPEAEVRTELSAIQADPEADVLALVTRDDLVSSVYAVTGSIALRTSCIIGTIINLLGGITGIIIMLALAYLGTVELLTPANVMLYQIFWLIPSLLATEWTRIV